MIYENILDLIGNTPVVKLNFLNEENVADIYVKLEKYNIGGSVKDRAALGMIEAAEKEGNQVGQLLNLLLGILELR